MEDRSVKTSQPDGFRLRNALPADAPSLSAFAAWIFEETFAAGNRREDIDAYLDDAFSADRQREEISDPHGVVVLAFRTETSALAGYAHIKFSHAERSAQLKRLYIDNVWQGSGLARLLLDNVRSRSKSSGCARLWLTVWDQNHRAIAFYRKSGFIDAGVTHFQLGDDLQTDLLMDMPLS
jgi:diamine N-acetyltransferase